MPYSDNPISDAIDYFRELDRIEKQMEENPVYKCDCCGKGFNYGVKIWDEKFCEDCDNEQNILTWYTSLSPDFDPQTVLNYIQSKKPIEP